MASLTTERTFHYLLDAVTRSDAHRMSLGRALNAQRHVVIQNGPPVDMDRPKRVDVND